MNQPFRWNVSKQEQLGSLVDGAKAESYPQFSDDLLKCCSKTISFCDNSNLVFVGRSPESIFDHLSGLLSRTSWSKRCTLFNISIRYNSLEELSAHKIVDFQSQLLDNNLSPQDIINSPLSTCFIDLVSSGSTLGNLSEALLYLGKKQKLDVSALKRKLRYVGITWQTKTSPNTWRWQQNVDWVADYKPSVIKNVSIRGRLWNYLGNNQQKVSPSNPPRRWGDEELQNPPHKTNHIESLRLALYLFRLGNSRKCQLEFAKQLSTETGMKYSWFRSLVNEIRSCK